MKTLKIKLILVLLTGFILNLGTRANQNAEPTGNPQIRQINFNEFALKYNTTDSKSKTYQFREAFEVFIPIDTDIEINVLFPGKAQKKNEILKLFRWDSNKHTWVYEKNIKIGKESIDGQYFRSINFSQSGIYAVFEDFKNCKQTELHCFIGRNIISGSITQENLHVKVSEQASKPKRNITFKTSSLSVLSEISLKVKPSRKESDVHLRFKVGELKPWQFRESRNGKIHIYIRKKDIERFTESHDAS